MDPAGPGRVSGGAGPAAAPGAHGPLSAARPAAWSLFRPAGLEGPGTRAEHI